jgi:uncharacterized membrane protein
LKITTHHHDNGREETMHTVEASILVNAPVAECYRHWMDFERYPEFMRRVVSIRRAAPSDLLPKGHHQDANIQADDPQKHYEGVMAGEIIHEVEVHGNRVWEWTVKGTMGQTLTTHVGIVMDMPNKAVTWASTHDEELATSGSVNFLTPSGGKIGRDQTLVEVKMSFSPPGGLLGELVSDMFHMGDNFLADALSDFKSYVEREYSQTLNPQLRATDEAPMQSESELKEQTGTPPVIRSNY